MEHETGATHPERGDRIRAIYRGVCDTGLIVSANPFGDFGLDVSVRPPGLPPLVEIQPAAAEERWLLEVHPARHVEHVKHVGSLSGVLDQGDTPSGPKSFETVLLAVGAGLACCDAVVAGRVKRAFAAVRPPGHHAEPDRAMGFCFFPTLRSRAIFAAAAWGGADRDR